MWKSISDELSKNMKPNPTSVENQVRVIRAAAKRLRLKILREYIDGRPKRVRKTSKLKR